MVLPGGHPEFRCRSCGAEWGRESDPTADEQALADLLGVSYRDVVRALGTGWRREELASGEDVHWFVSGEPAQVAIGVSGPTFVLARPLIEWGEARRDVPPPDDGRLSRDDLVWVPEVVADAVEVIASRRRRSFRWCRVCRRSQAPETFLAGAGICQQCDTMLGDWDRLAEPRADS